MVVASRYTVEVPEIPLHYVILSRFAEHGDRVAIVDGVTGREYTFNMLEELTRRIGSGLTRLGVRKGDLLAIYLANCPEFFLMYFACLRLGVIVSAANPSYTAYEFTYHLTDSKAQYIFAMKENYPNIKEACKKAPHVKRTFLLGDMPGCVDFASLVNDNGDMFPDDVDIDPKKDIAIVPYSSGTTGMPKGVMISHFNIVANFIQASQIRALESEQEDPYQMSLLAVLPFFHVYGLLVILTATLTFGAKIVTLPRFIPEQFLQSIQKYKITTLPLVPPLVIYLAKSPLVEKYDISSVQKVMCGAASLSKDTANAFRTRFKVSDLKQGYGMTETTMVATIPAPDLPYVQGSVGILVPSTEAQIVDPGSGAKLGMGDRGEIWLRGPQIMQGYLNKPEATKNTIDEDGWLHTGDIGYYDKDECFFITGRLKELIKYKGFQVPPAELEALLLEHPGVTEVAVIGIPDPMAGEIPRAFIIKTDHVNVTADELDKFVKERMTSYKWLRGGIQFVDHIPKTPSGKIIRREVAKLMPAKSKL